MSSHCQANSLLLKDYFLFIPNAVELFSSNFTFFSVFDIPAGLGGKQVSLVRKGLKYGTIFYITSPHKTLLKTLFS